MILDILLLLISLAMILFGASWLTDGGSGLAKRFGLSEMVVGLTVVAFGTSAPELVISVMSAAEGNAGIAIGNVVGSNIANVLLIIGVVAVVRPIKVGKSVMANEIPLMVLASLALLACGNASLLDGEPDAMTRVDGIMLLLFFAVFMRYTFTQAKKSDLRVAPPDGSPKITAGFTASADASRGDTSFTETGNPGKIIPLWKSVLLVAIGLTGLVWGGDIFVARASSLASALGVGQAVIGLTVVALGTSLPELATSVTAAVKGHPGLAVGNVIGSCLFNILFVLGVSAVIRPLPFGEIGNLDLFTMAGSAMLFWLAGWVIGHRVITRGEGVLFVLLYVAYTAALVIKA